MIEEIDLRHIYNVSNDEGTFPEGFLMNIRNSTDRTQ